VHLILPKLFKALLTAEIMRFIMPLPGNGVTYRDVRMAAWVFDKILSSRQIFLMCLRKRFHRFFTGKKEELGNSVYKIN
jgi:hypothetical protein